ncbi:MAG: hypothetical protein JW885_11070 [Deltaproteobacteria bacterium]|nr:hypothetical protein [Candidatus Zymogenaceae bacterium]
MEKKAPGLLISTYSLGTTASDDHPLRKRVGQTERAMFSTLSVSAAVTPGPSLLNEYSFKLVFIA